jgi:hypothetical protein
MPISAEAPVVVGNIRETTMTSPVGIISQLNSSQRIEDICDTISRHCRKERKVKCNASRRGIFKTAKSNTNKIPCLVYLNHQCIVSSAQFLPGIYIFNEILLC